MHKKEKKFTVLIFDSGVGGLSIYFKMKRLFPFIQYIYTFDNQSFPYGNKSSSYIFHRVVNIITTVWNLHKIDVIILACNTASIVAMSALRFLFFCPIIGIIPPIKYAVNLTKNRIIGLLATNTTLRSQTILNLVQKFSPFYTILSLDVMDLISLIEKKLYGEEISILEIQRFLCPWIEKNDNNVPDTVVLGCTHFLLIKKEIKHILNGVHLIDSSDFILEKLKNHIRKNKKSYTHFIGNISNIAYCSVIKSHTEKFACVLKSLGFDILKKIEL